MVLRRPAMNRSCNRENPDILIVMIADEQIMRGGEDDKERETMGPQKPAREMSGTAPKSNLLPHHSFFFLSLSIPLFYSCVALLSLSLSSLVSMKGSILCISPSHCGSFFWLLGTLFLAF
ncbi:hypothetical protein POPTR_018G054600v4 [Populus trichocarpa]|jgi:hypothetical protein|uniref:Uncharacterized protein n=1 Tax=Populus trichocarpa TaxID=3694 RepID=A0ACC0RMM5_POPTR|nr:hypothetical protein POPTR_018G054600v4 [Populus trichocarpa]